MIVFVDADGCPVIDITIQIARKFGKECILVCDTSHHFERVGAKTIIVAKGTDSVDFKLVNMVSSGDVVITQDYGLAAMCLAKRAIPVDQNGRIFNDENINGLLYQRDVAKRARMMGKKFKKIPKRSLEQDRAFENTLIAVISKRIKLIHEMREEEQIIKITD